MRSIAIPAYVVLAACGDSAIGTSYRCEVDEALVAQRIECVADDACPCGTHCELGLCAFECRTDEECGGGVCDGFGRCRAPGDSTLAAPRESLAPIAIEGRSIALDPAHPEGAFSVRGNGGPLGRVRVAGSDAVLVACGDDAPSTECTLEVDAGPRAIRVVLAGVPVAEEGHDVRVYSHDGVSTVHVRARPIAAVADAPIEGVYRGTSSPIALGLSSRRTPSTPSRAVREIAIPIEATIYPELSGRRRVVLRDSVGIVFPEGGLVGELLRASSGELRFQHAPQSYVREDGAVPVDVSVEGVTREVTRGRSGLGMIYRATFRGATADDAAPFVEFRVALGRTGDLPAGAVAPALPAAHVPADVRATAQRPLALESRIDSELAGAVLPADASDRAESILCTPYGGSSAIALGSAMTSWSGDLACADGAADPVLPPTFGLLREGSWNIGTTLAACMRDLARVEDVSSGTAAVRGYAGCVDGPRVIAALAAASEIDRRRALGEPLASDEAASALEHRLLAQWIALHAFVARQATQVDRLNDVLAGEDRIDAGFRQTEMLARTGDGFDLLLHPRVGVPLAGLSPFVVHSPDYRPRVEPGRYDANAAHDQWIGLPSIVTASMADTLRVYGALYDRARYVPADRVELERLAGEHVRKTLVLLAIAHAMYDNARANSTVAPAWQARWERDSNDYGVAFSALLRNVESFRRGGNPLDIDPELDLPLYRIGDERESSERFSALTDYLIGTGARGLDDSALAASRVVRAESSLEAARSAWASNVSRNFAEEVQSTAQNRRIEGIRRRYGEQVASLCGDFDSNTVLLHAADIDPSTCFVKPECRRTPDERRAALEPDEVAYAVCIASEIRAELGASAAGDVLATGFSPADLASILDGSDGVRGHTVSGARTTIARRRGSSIDLDSALLTYPTDGALGGDLRPDTVIAMQERCAAVSSSTNASRPALPPASCTLHGDCPVDYVCEAGVCAPNTSTVAPTSCFTGGLGEVAASLREAASDIAIARSELDELSEQYDLEMQRCARLSLGAEELAAETERHNDTMTILGGLKLAADVIANAAEATKDCASSVGSDNKFGVAGGVACGGAIAQQVASSLSAGLQFGMDELERSHSESVAAIEARTDNAVCLIEAEMALVGTNTAILRVQRASEELASRLVELENRKVDAQAALDEGVDALALESAREVAPMEIEYWLDARVEAYDADFRAARRAMYLAVLAVEYEMQLSLVERERVLAATRVSDLRGVLDRLRDLSVTGTIRGSLPSDLHTVVSLREHLLSLADQSALPAGWHRLSAEERFRAQLGSPRFARYDEAGRYLGQEIPFRIVPFGAVGLGDAHGVPILTGSDCAERLWSVNASLMGDGIVVGSDSTRTRVVVRKRNTFFSQWCGAESTPFQTRSTRPSRNLFLDPFADYVPGGPASAESNEEASGYTDARISPFVGVTRAELEADGYANGSSRELAGRGLYGDYALFFPAEVLSRDGSDGLDLDRVTDVLLRLEYVSVAR